MITSVSERYLPIIEAFVADMMSAQQFETLFLELHGNDRLRYSDEEYRIMQELFYAVDDYCSDPDYRNEDTIDEAQLQQAARLAAVALKSLPPHRASA